MYIYQHTHITNTHMHTSTLDTLDTQRHGHTEAWTHRDAHSLTHMLVGCCLSLNLNNTKSNEWSDNGCGNELLGVTSKKISYIHMYMHVHTHTHTYTHIHTRTHTYTHVHTRTHTHTHTYTHVHTRTYLIALECGSSLKSPMSNFTPENCDMYFEICITDLTRQVEQAYTSTEAKDITCNVPFMLMPSDSWHSNFHLSSTADEACYWLKCVLHSGWFRITSRPVKMWFIDSFSDLNWC